MALRSLWQLGRDRIAGRYEDTMVDGEDDGDHISIS